MPAPSSKVAEKTAAGPRYQPLVIVLAATCSGIAADRWLAIPLSVWWTAAILSWAAWLGLWRKRRDLAAAAALLLAVAATAAAWHHCRWFLFPADELGNFARGDKQPVCLQAIALKTPRTVPSPEWNPLRTLPAGDRSRLDIELVAVRDGDLWRPVSGRTQLDVQGRLHAIQPGDRLKIFGQLSRPRNTQNPGEFDYAAHLRARRQRSRIQSQFGQCVSVVAPGGSPGLVGLVERARSAGNRLLQRYLSPANAELAAAVLLGAREQLDYDRTQAFVETGTVHLLAISGLHVGILAGALLLMVRRCPISRGWGMLAVAGLVIFYMLLTDARPPVVRATVLVLAFCLSYYLGRQAVSFNSLAFAALVVLALNPADLFHTGAQLSFLAVAGLMWFGPSWAMLGSEQDPLDRVIAESRGWPQRRLWAIGRFVRGLTLVSATIWLLTMPLVMARFHIFSPVAVLLNTLLWVPMVMALMTGFGTLVLGILPGPSGAIFGYVCDASVWLLQTCVNAAREVPGSHFWVPGPADWWLAGFYGGLALLAAFPRIRPPRRWCLALLAVWIAVGFAAAADRDQPRLDCTFLSMGHGCAVVLELPDGKTLLYDAGRFGAPGSGTRSIAGFLWSRGHTHLDAVVLSHGDVDHYNALPGLLERFSVGVIYVSPMMFENDNSALTALKQAINESGVPLREIRASDLLPGGEDCRIEVLHPPQRGVLGGDNPNTIVLAVEYLGRRILLPGDLDTPGLNAVLAEEPLDCDVILAPHHGSRRSNPPGMAAWCTPEWVVISGSRRWDPGPVIEAYRTAGSRVLHTADVGAVSVAIEPTGVSVDSFLQP